MKKRIGIKNRKTKTNIEINKVINIKDNTR